jgi:3-hydroxyacyl-[acyl-carrier-protein] dehydratase
LRDDVRGAFVGLERTGEPGAFSATYRFDPERPVFKGHFPDNPLLPAVFGIEMVRHAAEAFSARQYQIAAVMKAKMSARVNPGEVVTLDGSLAATDEGVRVAATLRVEQEVKASVTVILRPA